MEVRRLHGDKDRQYIGALGGVLVVCVEGGASVGFLTPFSRTEGEDFFRSVFTQVESGSRILLAAFEGVEVLGTVQLAVAMLPNQPHRADVAKLLVRRSARGRGVAKRLMEEVEVQARRRGRTLLVLDTCSGSDAEQLYLRLGWTKAGVIPRYALWPDGSWCDTVLFWKWLDG